MALPLSPSRSRGAGGALKSDSVGDCPALDQARPRPAATVTGTPAVAVSGRYEIRTTTLSVQASQAPQLIDLTPTIARIILPTLAGGHVTVFCQHTTAALVLNEDECMLHQDVAAFLERLASAAASYRHDDLSVRTENLEGDHGRNGHAHLRQMVLGSSLVIPVVGGRLALGRWQKLFLVELDRPRPRTVLVQTVGVRGGRSF